MEAGSEGENWHDADPDETDPPVTAAPRSAGWVWAIVAAAVVALAGAALFIVGFPGRSTRVARPVSLNLLPPEGHRFVLTPVPSPDGTQVVFTARAATEPPALWIRALADATARHLAGTEGAARPFWSPDSRFIGFAADGRLKKIDALTGTVQTICVCVIESLGATWGATDVIVFAPSKRLASNLVARQRVFGLRVRSQRRLLGVQTHRRRQRRGSTGRRGGWGGRLLCQRLARDGRLIMHRDRAKGVELWTAAAAGGDKPLIMVRATRTVAGARVAPDGRSLAYVSDESGLFEVYVSALDGTRKIPISPAGGTHPRWHRNGRELLYLSRDNALMSAVVESGEPFRVSAPKRLFTSCLANRPPYYAGGFEVEADGSTLWLCPGRRAAAGSVSITTGWSPSISSNR